MSKRTIGKMLREGETRMTASRIADAKLDAQWLMSYVMNKPRIEILLNPNQEMEESQYHRYQQLVDRRIYGEPLQYLLGSQEFMGLDFYVDPRVLIPRQDTEVLVEEGISLVKKFWQGKANILELGTGSGAVAVSLARYLPDSRIDTIDIDDKALQVASLNARHHRLEDRIRFFRGDLFEGLPGELHHGYHVIISNPPYIPSRDIEGLQREVRDFEPRGALDGGADGLEFYRRISRDGPAFLADTGMILVEVGYNQAQRVKDIFSISYRNAYGVKDLAGIERVVGAWKKGADGKEQHYDRN